MSTEQLHSIAQLALKQFTSTLCKNRDYEWGSNRGTPPSKGYVEQKRFSREAWTNDPSLAAWKIEEYEHTTKIEPLIRLPKPVIDGMFFDWLIGNWGVTDDLKSLSVKKKLALGLVAGSSIRFLKLQPVYSTLVIVSQHGCRNGSDIHPRRIDG